MCQTLRLGKEVAEEDTMSAFQKLPVSWGRQTSRWTIRIWCGLKQAGCPGSRWGRAQDTQAEGAEITKQGLPMR